MRSIALIFLLFMLAAASGRTQEQRAFVVGINDYRELQDLQKAQGDAIGYVRTFRDDLGFKVTALSNNPSRADFNNAFGKFIDTVNEGDEVVFVFSGHGWSDGVENYLAFSDVARTLTEYELRETTVPVSGNVLKELAARKPGAVVAIIDACRDNPFDTATKSGFARGLGLIDAPAGTLVLYAAGEKQTALDRLGNTDTSPYSVFTRTLLPRLKDGSRPLLLIAFEVQDEVARIAGTIRHQQRPGVNVNIDWKYCFSGRCLLPAATLDPDTALWNAVPLSAPPQELCPALGRYVRAFPDGRYREEVGSYARRCPAIAELMPDSAIPFTDTLKDGSAGPELVIVKAGSMRTGSPEDETDRDKDEAIVSGLFGGLAAGRYEVTIGQYRKFVSATGRTEIQDCGAAGAADAERAFTKLSWRRPGYVVTEAMPVTCVSHTDARAYARWLSDETGQTYRLPSEAEWEHLARGGAATAYAFGRSLSQAEAKFSGSSRSPDPKSGKYGPSEAGRYPANGYNLFDMHGNVWEWTANCYAPSLTDALSKTICNSMTIRGGAWSQRAALARSANRGQRQKNERLNDQGFRVVRELD